MATAEAGLVYRTAGEFDSALAALANAAAGRGVAIASGDRPSTWFRWTSSRHRDR